MIIKPALKGVIDRIADYVTVEKNGNTTPARPPADVLDDMMTIKELPLPVLQGIIEIPVFDLSGKLHPEPGYQTETRYYLHQNGSLVIPVVLARPKSAALSKAHNLLLNELLGDFRFVSEADKAHAIAALLLPFVRHFIDGPTPLHLLNRRHPVPVKDCWWTFLRCRL